VTDIDQARQVRASVEREGGSLAVGVRELRDAFGRTRLTDKARWDIEDALGRVGVGCRPSLAAVELTETVVLFVTDRRPRSPRPSERSGPPSSSPPQSPDPGAGPGPLTGAGSGVVAAGGLATVIGFANYWLYGVICIGVVGFVLWLVERHGVTLYRSLAARLPFMRSPFIFGATVVAVSMLAVALVVIGPISESRRDAATEQVSSPGADSGDSDVGVPPDDDRDTRRRDAADAMEQRRYQDAIRIAEEELGDDDLAARYRRRAARETLDEAQDELAFGSTRRAIRLADRADRYDPTGRAERIRNAARDEIARARARRREREEEEAAPPPVAPEPEPEPLPEPDVPSGGSPGCLPSSACPGVRDGDGDGCYCE
jgi:hypothetical protein